MKIYIVGGYVRDTLLGLEPKDRDFVVTGSSPEEMISLGMSQVGKDFPVFLHPETWDEIALARTERKVGVGYDGFETAWKDVTIEEDLLRRDLTVNAIAQEVDDFVYPTPIGDLIDPYKGSKDIDNKVLHPVSEAFSEDPLRVLRVARLLARYPEFVATDQLVDMCKQCADELEYISRERIWLEIEKTLNSAQPRRFFDFLKDLDVGWLFEPLYKLESVCSKNDFHQEDNAYIHTMMVLDVAKDRFDDPKVSWAAIMHDLGKYPCFVEYGNMHGHEGVGVPIVEQFCKDYKVPNDYRDLALIVTKQHLKVHNTLGRGKNKAAKAKSIMKLFEETNAMKKPERFKDMLKSCEADAAGRIGIGAKEKYIQRQYLEECLQSVLDFKTKDLSQQLLSEGKSGILIGQRIREERIKCIRQVQNKWKEDKWNLQN